MVASKNQWEDDNQIARLTYEQMIIDLMIDIYCKGMKHERTGGNLCTTCADLQKYTVERNRYCHLLQTNTKTFCQFCETHCYSPERREAIREAMRYAGPRMFWHRPIIAIRHLMAVRKNKKQ